MLAIFKCVCNNFISIVLCRSYIFSYCKLFRCLNINFNVLFMFSCWFSVFSITSKDRIKHIVTSTELFTFFFGFLQQLSFISCFNCIVLSCRILKVFFEGIQFAWLSIIQLNSFFQFFWSFFSFFLGYFKKFVNVFEAFKLSSFVLKFFFQRFDFFFNVYFNLLSFFNQLFSSSNFWCFCIILLFKRT